MNFVKIIFLIVLIPLLAFAPAHKFYVSVTQIAYSEKDKALQITARIFIDDFEKILNERYDVQIKLATDAELKNSAYFIERYLSERFHLKINDRKQALTYLGREYETDVIKCYLEVQQVDVKNLTTISVENTWLFDGYEEQQNIVHVHLKNRRKSLALTRENDKGMLNF